MDWLQCEQEMTHTSSWPFDNVIFINKLKARTWDTTFFSLPIRDRLNIITISMNHHWLYDWEFEQYYVLDLSDQYGANRHLHSLTNISSILRLVTKFWRDETLLSYNDTFEKSNQWKIINIIIREQLYINLIKRKKRKRRTYHQVFPNKKVIEVW